MTITSLLQTRTETPRPPRQRLTRGWLGWLLGLLLLASSPAFASDAEKEKGIGRPPSHVEVRDFDPKVVSVVPDDLGTEGVIQSGSPTELVEYYAHDETGSVRVVFDSSGTVIGETTYSPFGQEMAGGFGMPSQRFAGQERDHEAQLDYFNARSYASRTGRFSSPDPLPGGPANPQSWNRYAYGLNNPLMYGDPTGLAPCVYYDLMYHCQVTCPPDCPPPAWPGSPWIPPLDPCDYFPESCSGGGGTGGGGGSGPGPGNPGPGNPGPGNPGPGNPGPGNPGPGNPGPGPGNPGPGPGNPGPPGCTGDPVCGNTNDPDGIPGPESDSNVVDITDQTLSFVNPFRGLAKGALRSVVLSARSGQAPLRLIHSIESFSKATLEQLRKKATWEIIDSLAPNSKWPLTVKPDGRVMDGNQRISVLMERGVDVNALPRTPSP